MASEAVETAAPAANGDLHTEEDEKSKMRPADIDADMREMERRKRVEAIMNSRMFREELERIIETQIRDGGSGAAGLLQQLSDMMGVQPGRLQSASLFRGSSCVVPINDLRGVEAMAYTQAERLLRCKLAAGCRLMDLHGWASASAPAHVSARVSQSAEHFLVNPWGLLCHEVTASSLVKLDMQGAIVEAGTTNFAVNAAAFQLHASIHAARPDVRCVIHLATPQAIAVSSLKTGLLPVCPAAAVLGEVPLHIESSTNLSDPAERDKLARALGPNSKVILLANRGAVCCGESVEEAFFLASNTATACDTQIKLAPLGLDNLILLPEQTRRQLYDACRRPPPTAAAIAAAQSASGENTATTTPGKDKPWRVGGLEFEALMRMLDNAGFRTGYLYRHPLVRGDPPRPRHDIEVPPAVSSLGFLLDQEGELGPWRSKLADGRKTHDRSRWLNSPNVYQKVEILETGTPDPKKITKWVADGGGGGGGGPGGGSPSHTAGGTPVRIEDALQFVPKNTDPKEFKRLQQQIKENRRADKITSGPQSHILEGVAWDEAKKLQDANMSATGDQVILMGAASKGIIQRGHQHNAMVYKTPYARNPFDAVTDEELDEYRRTVERRTKGEDEPQSESAPEDVTAPLKSPVTSPASETEDESRDEMRVLRIETKTAPMPSQPEVVLSDEFLQMEREYSQPPMSVNKGLILGPFGEGFNQTPARKELARWRPNRRRRRPRLGLARPLSPPTPHPKHFHLPISPYCSRILYRKRIQQNLNLIAHDTRTCSFCTKLNALSRNGISNIDMTFLKKLNTFSPLTSGHYSTPNFDNEKQNSKKITKSFKESSKTDSLEKVKICDPKGQYCHVQFTWKKNESTENNEKIDSPNISNLEKNETPAEKYYSTDINHNIFINKDITSQSDNFSLDLSNSFENVNESEPDEYFSTCRCTFDKKINDYHFSGVSEETEEFLDNSLDKVDLNLSNLQVSWAKNKKPTWKWIEKMNKCLEKDIPGPSRLSCLVVRQSLGSPNAFFDDLDWIDSDPKPPFNHLASLILSTNTKSHHTNCN